jgi:hypothetical protein
MAPEEVLIRGEEAHTVSPEGVHARMSVRQLLETISRAHAPLPDTGIVLPDGVRYVTSQGRIRIVVHESPPQVRSLKWIAKDSPEEFGQGTEYRDVRVALPYLVVVGVFVPGDEGLRLSGGNECFFRNHPLRSLDDELYYPALLNCSKFREEEGHPLSWICTTQMDHSRIDEESDEGKRLHAGLAALLHCLLETGFNMSSENHEENSWFSITSSSGIDERLATIEDWEAASEKNSLFVLDVPWLSTGRTLAQVIRRIFDNMRTPLHNVESAGDIARIIFNRGTQG